MRVSWYGLSLLNDLKGWKQRSTDVADELPKRFFQRVKSLFTEKVAFGLRITMRVVGEQVTRGQGIACFLFGKVSLSVFLSL